MKNDYKWPQHKESGFSFPGICGSLVCAVITWVGAADLSAGRHQFPLAEPVTITRSDRSVDAERHALGVAPCSGMCPDPGVVVHYDGGCPGNDDWSCPANWEPDGVPAEDDCVVLDASDMVFLDVEVEIFALCLRDDAVLRVTGLDEEPEDLRVGPGGIDNQGTILVSDRRNIVAAGPVIIGPSGRYSAEVPGSGGDAGLTASSITIQGGPAGEAGQMILESNMQVSTAGDLVLVLNDGDDTPPDFIVFGAADVRVGSSFEIQGDAHIVYASSLPIRIQGDFLNNSTAPAIFDWVSGHVLLGAKLPAGPAQKIEAAGEDVGPDPSGQVDNFAIGILTVGTGATLELIDELDNQQDGFEISEALYVDVLIVSEGATLNAQVPLYYNTLFNQGTIVGYGTTVVSMSTCPADLDGSDSVGAEDLALLLGTWDVTTGNPADLNTDGAVNAADLAMMLGSWGPCE